MLTEVSQHLLLRLGRAIGCRIVDSAGRQKLTGAPPLGGDQVTGPRRLRRRPQAVLLQRVLRMPWWRIRLRSVYSARSTASREGCAIRAIADRTR